MIKTPLLYILLFCITFVNAQSSWKKIESENYKAKSELKLRKSNPTTFDLYSLDIQLFKEEVSKNNIISIPVNGEFSKFTIKESSVFTNTLAPKYGYIKSFTLKGIDDKTATGKISINTQGVHVIIFSGKHGTIYIDPYTIDNTSYIAYKKSALDNSSEHTCLVDEKYFLPKIALKNNITAQRNANDGILRTYRLALASTVEYSNFHINDQGVSNGTNTQKEAAVLSAMQTTIDRVNTIFERDLSVTMTIVLNADGENELIFIDSDDFSNDDTFDLLEENQDICDEIIGTENYDIGHVFFFSSTGGDGLAIQGTICINGFKAQGVTGNSSLIGDSFDIDFVAHELGHQFGASHTFNGTTGSCGGSNRDNNTAVEPGSGTTIMGYAGICGSQNVQNNSDDYFHAVSIDQMWTVIQASSCEMQTSTNNSAPTVNAGNDFSVPVSTPLVLRGEASDNDGDILTYCWEQTDNEIVTVPPVSTNLAGASFKSFSPTTSPNRYLPSLSTVIDGSTETEWEVIPSVAREMNFSLVVRDNNENGGASERDDMTITVIDIDPFIVTSQTTAVSWEVGTTETITWNTSTTNETPINCENVKITLSTDGGLTFPITLVESTPNDGSYNLIVPNQLTSNARIMIEGVDNIFYNVNASNFSIISTGPIFILSNLSENTETCNAISETITYQLDINYINNFSENVNLTIEDLPDGVSAILSDTLITSDEQVTITINNFDNLSTGNYTISITGTSESLSSTIELPTISVNSNAYEEVTLLTPLSNTADITTQNLLFEWVDLDTNALLYDLEIATDNTFEDIIFSIENLTIANYTLTEFLDFNTTFYWRVKPKNNCGEGDYSSVYNFTTEDAGYCESDFTRVQGNEFITNVTLNTLDNNSGNDDSDGTEDGYEDFTDRSTFLIPGTTYDLSVTFDPVGFQDHCYVFIDWNGDTRFDETAERFDLGSSFENDITIASTEITVPNDATLGETRMRVIIEYFDSTSTFGEGACNEDHNSEFGETEDYSITITDTLIIDSDDVFDNFAYGPNPVNNEYINLKFDIPNNSEKITITLSDTVGKIIKSYAYNSFAYDDNLFIENNIEIENVSAGVYFLKVKNGNKETTKKLIIE